VNSKESQHGPAHYVGPDLDPEAVKLFPGYLGRGVYVLMASKTTAVALRVEAHKWNFSGSLPEQLQVSRFAELQRHHSIESQHYHLHNFVGGSKQILAGAIQSTSRRASSPPTQL